MPAFLFKHSCRSKSPLDSSSLRPNLPGICGAAELHVLEVLHGEFMILPAYVFWARFLLFFCSPFPSSLLSHLDTHQTLVST